MKEIFKIAASISIGVLLVFLIDFFINLEFFQLLIAKKLVILLSLFFDNVEQKNFSIYLNNIEFIITDDCIKLSAFFMILPFLTLNKKFKLIILFFFLFYFQNFFRIFFEIGLFLYSEKSYDLFFSNFQNVVQPFALYFLAIFKLLRKYRKKLKNIIGL
ncbi:MAG: hypothetical protein QXO40_02765 [Candidatus Aenigmatarchaeota archaeon]